ncbi:unnamed protein product [Echinostoma caproni]|uniref:MH2 domain-containing protein n=1 Tax=Echinostoma caproni TaxID=27848 RepID=A0A183B1Y9_9TREM|nr:unnamed protein product [Echinostoma caproni]
MNLNYKIAFYNCFSVSCQGDRNHGDLWPQDMDGHQTDLHRSSSEESVSTRTGACSSNSDNRELPNSYSDKPETSVSRPECDSLIPDDYWIECENAQQVIETLKTVDPIVGARKLVRMGIGPSL